SELAPPDGDVAVEDQRGVGSVLADESLLECSIGVVRELLLGVEGVEPRAPATAPHAVVSFRQAREGVPRLRSQRSNGEGRVGVPGQRPQLKGRRGRAKLRVYCGTLAQPTGDRRGLSGG